MFISLPLGILPILISLFLLQPVSVERSQGKQQNSACRQEKKGGALIRRHWNKEKSVPPFSTYLRKKSFNLLVSVLGPVIKLGGGFELLQLY